MATRLAILTIGRRSVTVNVANIDMIEMRSDLGGGGPRLTISGKEVIVEWHGSEGELLRHLYGGPGDWSIAY